jgi:hypothetical protein
MFYDYKGSFSIILIAVVDANYKCVCVDVRGDGGIFSSSALGIKMANNDIEIPDPRELARAPSLGKLLFVILGDKVFPLKTNMMR